MLTYINDIIGVTYADQPVVWIVCTFLIFWFMYQMFNLIYIVLGLKK